MDIIYKIYPEKQICEVYLVTLKHKHILDFI